MSHRPFRAALAGAAAAGLLATGCTQPAGAEAGVLGADWRSAAATLLTDAAYPGARYPVFAGSAGRPDPTVTLAAAAALHAAGEPVDRAALTREVRYAGGLAAPAEGGPPSLHLTWLHLRLAGPPDDRAAAGLRTALAARVVPGRGFAADPGGKPDEASTVTALRIVRLAGGPAAARWRDLVTAAVPARPCAGAPAVRTRDDLVAATGRLAVAGLADRPCPLPSGAAAVAGREVRALLAVPEPAVDVGELTVAAAAVQVARLGGGGAAELTTLLRKYLDAAAGAPAGTAGRIGQSGMVNAVVALEEAGAEARLPAPLARWLQRTVRWRGTLPDRPDEESVDHTVLGVHALVLTRRIPAGDLVRWDGVPAVDALELALGLTPSRRADHVPATLDALDRRLDLRAAGLVAAATTDCPPRVDRAVRAALPVLVDRNAATAMLREGALLVSAAARCGVDGADRDRAAAALRDVLRTAPAADIAASPWFTLGRVQAACLLGDDPAPHAAAAQRALDRAATAPPTPGTWSLEDTYGALVLDATLPEDPCRPGWWAGIPAG